MTLLILDRQSASRRRLYDFFVDRFETVAVGSFFGACRLLRHHHFDVILVKTAGSDAFAVALLKWLQAHRLATGTIALLDRGARDEGELLHRLGASSMLRWPASEHDVRRAVCAVASSQPFRGIVSGAETQPVAGANGNGSHATPATCPRLARAEGRVPARRRTRYWGGISRLGVSVGAQLASNN